MTLKYLIVDFKVFKTATHSVAGQDCYFSFLYGECSEEAKSCDGLFDIGMGINELFSTYQSHVRKARHWSSFTSSSLVRRLATSCNVDLSYVIGTLHFYPGPLNTWKFK